MKLFEGRLPVFFLTVLCLFLYGSTLDYPMVFDDEIYIVGNPIFKEAANFKAILFEFERVAKMANQRGLDGDLSTNFLMRPITYLSFYWNHSAGELRPWGYRLVNVLIHFTNTLLVWHLITLLMGSRTVAHTFNTAAQRSVPFMSAVIFLIHPLQIESVVYIIQRATSMCTLFYLIAVVCHFKANQANERWWRMASILAGVSAMLTKESGVTLPVLVILLDILVFETKIRRAIWNARFLALLLPLVPLLVIAVSHSQNGKMDWSSALTIAHGGGQISHSVQYVLTQPEVWLRYLALFTLPISLNVDPDILLVSKVSDIRFYASALGLISLAGVALFLRSHAATRFVGEAGCFALIWFAVTISPDSSFVPLPDCMAEHRSYLPLIGMCFLASAILITISNHLGILAAVCIGVTALLSHTTLERLQVWSSSERFWIDACQKSPQKPRPWLNLGVAQFEAGKITEAGDSFEQSIRVLPTPAAFANLCAVYLKRSLPDRAYEIGKEGLKFRPSGYDHFLLNNLGHSCIQTQRWKEGAAAYQDLTLLRPDNLDFRLRLAHCLLNLGNSFQAMTVLEEGYASHPDSPVLRNLITELQSANQRATVNSAQ